MADAKRVHTAVARASSSSSSTAAPPPLVVTDLPADMIGKILAYLGDDCDVYAAERTCTAFRAAIADTAGIALHMARARLGGAVPLSACVPLQRSSPSLTALCTAEQIMYNRACAVYATSGSFDAAMRCVANHATATLHDVVLALACVVGGVGARRWPVLVMREEHNKSVFSAARFVLANERDDRLALVRQTIVEQAAMCVYVAATGTAQQANVCTEALGIGFCEDALRSFPRNARLAETIFGALARAIQKDPSTHTQRVCGSEAILNAMRQSADAYGSLVPHERAVRVAATVGALAYEVLCNGKKAHFAIGPEKLLDGLVMWLVLLPRRSRAWQLVVRAIALMSTTICRKIDRYLLEANIVPLLIDAACDTAPGHGARYSVYCLANIAASNIRACGAALVMHGAPRRILSTELARTDDAQAQALRDRYTQEQFLLAYGICRGGARACMAVMESGVLHRALRLLATPASEEMAIEAVMCVQSALQHCSCDRTMRTLVELGAVGATLRWMHALKNTPHFTRRVAIAVRRAIRKVCRARLFALDHKEKCNASSCAGAARCTHDICLREYKENDGDAVMAMLDAKAGGQ